ncbi:MAG: Abi family protein [Saccharofermentanales bacterium]
MAKDKPKSTNGLMKYLRDKKNISISGSSHKRNLRNIGYYHGYKGYRYITNQSIKIPYTDFNELLTIYNFDMKVKSLIYPHIMFIETALKNYVLEILVEEAKSENFSVIYSEILDDYKSITNKAKKDEAVRKRLNLRDHVYSVLTRDYSSKNKIVHHFYQRDKNVPIWAIFERISLGEFANLVSCMNLNARLKVSTNLGLNPGCDTDKKLTQCIIFAIKDLRNSIAHNDIIFDTRFKSGDIKSSVSECVSRSSKIKNITFGSITDYIILITYLLRLFHVSKTELNRFITDFESITQLLMNHVPQPIFSQIIYTDTKVKMQQLKNFVK